MKINYYNIIFSFIFYHLMFYIFYLFGYNYYLFPQSFILWAIWITIFTILENLLLKFKTKNGVLYISYNKKLTLEQINQIQESFKNYLRGINKTLGLKQEYEIIWTRTDKLTEFKANNVPDEVAKLSIEFLRHLKEKY